MKFTDCERELNEEIIKKSKQKQEILQKKTNAVMNILRTPRLTEQFQRKMSR